MRHLLPLVLLGACAEPTVPDVDDPGDPTADPIEAYDPLTYVDPFIATGGQGAEIANVNPGATMPLGMTQVGPDTRLDWGAPLFYHCAGYWYEDDYLRGFGATHAHGMGVPDYGTLGFLPRDGWDDAYTVESGRMAPFSHADEVATPGYYAVTLGDDGTRVEIAATTHGGHSRLTFAAGADPVVVWDLGYVAPSGRVDEAWATWAPDDPDLEIFQRALGSYSERFGGLMQYAAVRFDPAPIGGGGWEDPDAPQDGLTHVEGGTSGVWLRFPEGTTTVHVRMAMSYVGHAGAWANLEAELPDTDFDARKAEAEDAWRALLSRVRVQGGTDDERTIFHTALYHTLIFPSRQDDVDGRYRGLDQQIHTADGPQYSDLSMWDTFRTLHPWYTLAWPELQTDVLRSLVRMVVDGGSLPKWPLAHGYTGGMVGAPATQILAGSWLKGLRDFDVDTAFDAALENASGPTPNAGRGHIEAYLTRGWLGTDEEGGSVSKTLEYAWNDHSLALWADALGSDQAARLHAQAGSWRNVWDDAVGFNTGRTVAGAFEWTGDPKDWASWFVEGNAWHYVWYVPYDVPGMIDLQHGGDLDAFAERLTTFWDGVYAEPEDNFPDDLYWHGNEPVMHYAFLGSLAGRPELTADPARWILAHRYANDPAGLDGNDDAGTLSAWYLFASIGLFPVAGTPDYAWSSPLFERVEIERTPTDTLVIRAPGASDTVRYFDGWSVDGQALDGPMVTHDQLVGGRELAIGLSATRP
ncbi:MAG: glycoside hydrolase family 92 protein [Alphaproteobacteria bacterium]|nr:glycoside hydrolase family 92 protein [Alphaproteobacteria bacterium]